MKTKKVHFIFDAQFCGFQEIIKDINENEVYADNLINELFPKIMGIKFDNNCRIYIPEDGILIEHDEVYEVEQDNRDKEQKIKDTINDIYNKFNFLVKLMEE